MPNIKITIQIRILFVAVKGSINIKYHNYHKQLWDILPSSRRYFQGAVWQMDPVINKIKTVLMKKKVKLAILFGSRALDINNKYSDFDIAILTDNDIDLENLVCELAKAIRVPEDMIDITLIHNELPYELLFNIFRDGILLVGDRKLFEELMIKYAEMYWDFKEFCRIHKLNEKYLYHLKKRKDE